MTVKVNVTKSFKKQAKRLLKKYVSLNNDLRKLEQKLKVNPELGDPLGHGLYKIRLSVTSKGKEKRAGMRIITYLETEIICLIESEKEDITVVNLISIYDKSEVETITKKELRNLIKSLMES